MGLVERIANRQDEPSNRPGPKPKMAQLFDILPKEDAEALEELILDRSYSAPVVHVILKEEADDLVEKAKQETEQSVKTEMLKRADLLRVSAFTIGRFRRQVEAGSMDVG